MKLGDEAWVAVIFPLTLSIDSYHVETLELRTAYAVPPISFTIK